MAISFRDYVLISDAFEANQLEEGKLEDIWAYVKKKLGGKATDDKIEKEIERLKLLDKKDIDKIKKTAASRDFHARKAALAAAPPKARQTQPTISHHSGIEAAKANLAAAHRAGKTRAGQNRAGERAWMGEAEQLDEAQEFIVTYKLKTGDVAKRWKTGARDAQQAKRKFNDSHLGAKIVSVEPAKGGSKVPMKKQVEKPAVDEDFEPFDD